MSHYWLPQIKERTGLTNVFVNLPAKKTSKGPPKKMSEAVLRRHIHTLTGLTEKPLQQLRTIWESNLQSTPEYQSMTAAEREAEHKKLGHSESTAATHY
jgi:hypothetical protein